MRALVEIDNPHYLMLRAQELIDEAIDAADRDGHRNALNKAISILALHLVKDENITNPPKPRARPKPAGKLVREKDLKDFFNAVPNN